jgi:hypothetical protein
MSKNKPLSTISRIFLIFEECVAICFLAGSLHVFVTFFSPNNSVELFGLDKNPSKAVILSTSVLIGGYCWFCLKNIDAIKKD